MGKQDAEVYYNYAVLKSNGSMQSLIFRWSNLQVWNQMIKGCWFYS
jgi:hypothetical protein